MNKGVGIGGMFFIVIVSFLFSCEEKTVDYGFDNYYVEIVTAQNENEFLSDNGKIIVVSSSKNKNNYTAGDRVLINYTLLSEDDSGDRYNVRINGSSKIPLGKLSLTNDSTINASAVEPIFLESVWLGRNYLNMSFYLNYRSITHSIGLLADSMRMESDTLRMYFIHDSKNDPPGYPSHAYLSFDLKDVLRNPEKTRQISIQINTSNFGNKIYGFEY